jgi:hypothetical protein
MRRVKGGRAGGGENVGSLESEAPCLRMAPEQVVWAERQLRVQSVPAGGCTARVDMGDR